MNVIQALLWKETRSFVRERKTLASLLIVVAVAVVNVSTAPSAGVVLGAQLPMVAAVACLCTAYVLPWETFYLERHNRTLASLLAGPLNVRLLFLGKQLWCSLVMLILDTLAVAALAIVSASQRHPPAAPVAIAVALVIVPIWGHVLIQVMSLGLVLLGNVTALRYLMILVLTAGMSAARTLTVPLGSNQLIGLVGLLGLLVSLFLTWLSSHLSAERLLRFD